ncbi:MAG: hypothetical protein AAGC63_13235 [Propionicimonas sp.]
MVLLAALTGCLLAGGLFALALVRTQRQPRLADIFDLLDGRHFEVPEPEAGLGRVGAWARLHLGLAVADETQRRRLRMVGTSVDRHLAHKVVSGFVGLLVPAVVGVLFGWLTGAVSPLPALFSLVGGVVGFLLPDILLRRRDSAVTEDATEALLTFFDLVTLERLANRSGTQALRAAAAASEVTVFRAIGDALERTRLEQRAPYDELGRLGRELELPALVDVADVMRLDEAGASLSTALRARVKELRDAHLTRTKLRAAETSERMGVLMVLPTLLFGLLFLVPPLLRLLSS